METKLTGSLEFCREEHCINTVHYEDSPDYYPFCLKHKASNISYRQYKKEHEEILTMYTELYGQ